MSCQDLTRDEWRARLSDNGAQIELEVAIFTQAAKHFAKAMARLGAIEESWMTPERHVDQILNTAMAAAPEEVRDYLENATGPMLPMPATA